jgi:hypothetical protein
MAGRQQDFGLADVMKAYDTFGNAAKERASNYYPPKHLAGGQPMS